MELINEKIKRAFVKLLLALQHPRQQLLTEETAMQLVQLMTKR